jgi:putative glutamine amidotransferase
VVLKNLLDQVEADLNRLDGIVFTGGPDLDPKLYGAEPPKKKRQMNRKRDEYERLLMHRATKHGIAVLAICRGLQIANVEWGGTLHQDLPHDIPSGTVIHNDWKGRFKPLPEHTVTVEPDSLLARLTGSTKFPTNATHHQGIKKLGKKRKLRIVARTGDGLGEALELCDAPGFWAAVQWHPERTLDTDDGQSLGIFDGFIVGARETEQRRAASGRSVREPLRV